jgi:hypothetical protein
LNGAGANVAEPHQPQDGLVLEHVVGGRGDAAWLGTAGHPCKGSSYVPTSSDGRTPGLLRAIEEMKTIDAVHRRQTRESRGLMGEPWFRMRDDECFDGVPVPELAALLAEHWVSPAASRPQLSEQVRQNLRLVVERAVERA